MSPLQWGAIVFVAVLAAIVVAGLGLGWAFNRWLEADHLLENPRSCDNVDGGA